MCEHCPDGKAVGHDSSKSCSIVIGSQSRLTRISPINGTKQSICGFQLPKQRSGINGEGAAGHLLETKPPSGVSEGGRDPYVVEGTSPSRNRVVRASHLRL